MKEIFTAKSKNKAVSLCILGRLSYLTTILAIAKLPSVYTYSGLFAFLMSGAFGDDDEKDKFMKELLGDKYEGMKGALSDSIFSGIPYVGDKISLMVKMAMGVPEPYYYQNFKRKEDGFWPATINTLSLIGITEADEFDRIAKMSMKPITKWIASGEKYSELDSVTQDRIRRSWIDFARNMLAMKGASGGRVAGYMAEVFFDVLTSDGEIRDSRGRALMQFDGFNPQAYFDAEDTVISYKNAQGWLDTFFAAFLGKKYTLPGQEKLRRSRLDAILQKYEDVPILYEDPSAFKALMNSVYGALDELKAPDEGFMSDEEWNNIVSKNALEDGGSIDDAITNAFKKFDVDEK